MKRALLSIILVASLIMLSSLSGPGFNPVGKWNFSAMGAPPEYEKGVFEITSESDRYQVYIVFADSDYKIPCEKVIYNGEKLTFSLYLDIDEIRIALTFDGEDKLAGNAETPDGAIPLVLTRVKASY